MKEKTPRHIKNDLPNNSLQGERVLNWTKFTYSRVGGAHFEPHPPSEPPGQVSLQAARATRSHG